MNNISIVAAISDNNAIGKNVQLLWRMPADMKRFKELTTGHAVIMGRKTFESLPKGALPNRKNIVLTTLPEAGFVNCFACESMHDALDICEKEEKIFIIGGALVYRQGLSLADTMYLTRVHHEFKDADSFFPVVNWDLWKEVERQEFPADADNPYPYTFLTYVRKK
ncbi:dihydrofolate reductase [Parabacteroides sp. APC149_11_2_Y6]